MDSWKMFKEDFYSRLSMEDITNFDYRHAKIYSKNLK